MPTQGGSATPGCLWGSGIWLPNRRFVVPAASSTPPPGQLLISWDGAVSGTIAMKPGSLLLALGSLVLWALPLLLGAPPKGRCLLKCQRDEDCPVGHTCASFRGRHLCRPVAAVAGSGVPGAASPSHGSHTGTSQSSGAHPKGATASDPPLLDASLGDMQLTQNHSVPTSPPLGEKPASNVDSEHTAHGRPVSSGKPALVGKPTPTLGNQTQASPTPGSKPTAHPGKGAHKEMKPMESHTQGNETHEKPESAEKPAPDKKPEPAEEAKKDGDDSSTEGVEKEDEDDVEENDDGPGGESDADSDAFDKELDYGLDRSPYNAYEYHDAWSDDGSDYPKEWLDPEPYQHGGDFGDGEPVFDVWGDRIARRGLETG